MPIILTVNTAFETASVILSSDQEIILEKQNAFQKDHASFLEPTIKTIIKEANLNLSDVDAISVINGPGSYTGLRVGLSSAKAICFALDKPLILLNTLDVMALALKLQAPIDIKNILFCPLIDARRLEAFTALYDENLKMIKPYNSELLDNNFLKNETEEVDFIIIGGNGSDKFQKITNNKNFIYINPLFMSKPAIILGNKAFTSKIFADTAYCEPFYLKPVYFKN